MPYTVANYPEYRKEWARIKAQSIPALSASLRGSIDERIEIDFLEARRKAHEEGRWVREAAVAHAAKQAARESSRAA